MKSYIVHEGFGPNPAPLLVQINVKVLLKAGTIEATINERAKMQYHLLVI